MTRPFAVHVFPPGSRVVCTVTGHGLKDSDVVLQRCPPINQVPADLSAVLALLEC